MDILIVRNNSNSKAIDASLLLVTYLNSQGLAYHILEASDLNLANEPALRQRFAHIGFEMAVVLGGDGTILRTARFIGDSRIPILGINFGHLGFLANAGDDGVVAMVASALAGDVVREHRTHLRISIGCECDDLDAFPPIDDDVLDVTDEIDPGSGNHLVSACSPHSFFSLNELAVTRGAMGRVIDFNLKVSDVSIADMRGDGVVVATATGSTAYALSAGGPLVAPGFDGLVVVPVAPHTLHSRSVVTSGSDIVEIDLTNNIASREASIFIDGEPLVFESTPQKICVRKADQPTILLRYAGSGFYEHVSQVFF